MRSSVLAVTLAAVALAASPAWAVMPKAGRYGGSVRPGQGQARRQMS